MRQARFGCFELAASLDHIGPMCRSALDCLVRDISHFGARLTFTKAVTVPDVLIQPHSAPAASTR